jgi:hypothetical protein
LEEALKSLVDFAKSTGVGWWQLIAGICFVIVVIRTPELLKISSEFVNERRRINGALALQQDQSRRRLAAARARRKKVGQK